MEKMIMMGKETVTLTNTEEVCKELNEFQNFVSKDVIINVIGGFAGSAFISNFYYGICTRRDGEDYLSLIADGTDINYTVDLREIEKVEKDNFLNQIFITLKNRQILQVWTDDDEHEN